MQFSTLMLATVMGFASFAVANNYANFFDDSACSVNGGIGVDITNDGCLGKGGNGGRGSVYIPDNGDVASTYCLVITHGDNTCSCQNVGYNFSPTGFCKTLDSSDQSYRFITQACSANNC
ncbi:hypothetical protein FIBSPDRAFT_855018 [Athelia psychrophila]|uniref:Uncharacterized protein n=1 Tax=Athelia psychrophila TaxID=1759441 RepID=A0A166PRU9_9AGAM|nr:hypothetical protein FIBSPDRAFT_855018 [Fibularhizoctonia sp. CBS 109695]